MAVTVTNNMSTWDTADSSTGWTTDGGSFTAYSGFQREGTNCLGDQASNGTVHFYNTGTSTDLSDHTIFVWMRSGNPTSEATGGFRIVVGDGTNRVAYYVGGNDNYGFFYNGWSCFKLNSTNLPANFTTLAGAEASLTWTAITELGSGYNYGSKAVGNADNIFVDIIRYVSNSTAALTIGGGTSGDRGTFAEIVAVDESTSNAYGIFRQLIAGSKAYDCNFGVEFGNSLSSASYFQDADSQIFLSGTNMDTGAMDWTLLANATGTNSFILDNCIFVNIGTDSNWDVSNANFDEVQLTNSQIVDIGTFSSPTADTSKFVRGTIFNDTGTVTVSTMDYDNDQFNNAVGTAMLISSASHDVTDTSFTGNNIAIEIDTASTSYTFNNLTFSGNTYDVENSSTGQVEIAATNGANPGTYAYINTGNTFEASSAQSYNANTTTYTDETTDINNATTNDVALPPIQATTAGDAIYFGDSATFTGITLDLGTAGSYSDITITWQYWNGAWTTISDVVDDTNGFTATAGTYTINFRDPIDNADWATTAVNGTTAYWIRAVTSFGASPAITTSPLGTQAWHGYTIINNSVSLEVNGVVQNTQCYIVPSAGGTALLNATATTLVSGDEYKATDTLNYSADTDVVVRAREMGYLPFETNATVTANGLTVTAVWQVDPNWKLVVEGVNITFNENSPSDDTIVRASGSFVTDGWLDVMGQVTVEGSGSNDGTYEIQTVAATTLTLATTEDLVQEGPVSGVTLTFTRREPTW